eukprot:scaffold602_cov342-Prasinococcus_capsulatus_cf.AAC.24
MTYQLEKYHRSRVRSPPPPGHKKPARGWGERVTPQLGAPCLLPAGARVGAAAAEWCRRRGGGGGQGAHSVRSGLQRVDADGGRGEFRRPQGGGVSLHRGGLRGAPAPRAQETDAGGGSVAD